MFFFSVIRNALSKPHPYIFNWPSAVIPAVATFLVIVIFKPFGMQDLEFTMVIMISTFLTLLVFITIFGMVWAAQKLFPKWVDQDSWTMGKEIVQVLCVLGAITTLIFISVWMVVGTVESVLELFIIVFLRTIGVSILPILIMILFEQYSHKKKQLAAAMQINGELKVWKQANKDEIIMLYAENGKPALQLLSNELIFLQSDGNYVDVFHTSQDGITKTMVRNRLKHLGEALPSRRFFQCHKRYIINGYHVQKVEGNARNLELSMRGIEKKVPVSRANNQAIGQFLHALPSVFSH